MQEIKANMDAFATSQVLERTLYGSNTIALWTRRSKQKDEEIPALILEMDTLLKETIDKSVIIADQKVELDCLCTLFNESTIANVAPQQDIPAAQSKDTKMEVNVVALTMSSKMQHTDWWSLLPHYLAADEQISCLPLLQHNKYYI